MNMTNVTTDPTAFMPMAEPASRDTEVGHELEPFVRNITLDKMRIVSNWPKNKDFHNDWGAAQKNGLKQPIAIGVVLVDQIAGLLLRFFREGYLGGGLSIKYIGLILPDDVITTRGVVTRREDDGDSLKLHLDVWCENQRGEKVIVGTASGLVLSVRK